jgi:alpha-N-arabinofuranosidase
VLTIVNPDTNNAQETQITVNGSRISNVQATVLTSSDIKAHNTFEQPNALKPSQAAVTATGSPLVYSFAPASVTKLEFDLA